MKCKPGDLVILTGCDAPALRHYVGSIRTVRQPCDVWPNSWDLDPKVIGSNGLEASWADKDLIPIRDNDGEDEMIRIAGLPHKEIA